MRLSVRGIMNYTAIAITSALLAVLLLAGCTEEVAEQKTVARPIMAVKVADGTILASRQFPGRAKATQEVDLSFRVGGPLITRADVGDEFKEADVVARIDPRNYEVKIEEIDGQLSRAKATLTRAQSDYERVVSIYKADPGATSQAEIDRKLAQRDQAKADIKSLEASLDSAKDDLSYTYLKAPFDGTIVATYVENFEDVRRKQAVMRLLDTSSIEMIINIPESMISYSPYVENIRVTFDAFPGQEIPAKIKEVGTEASATTRTYPVTLIMVQPEDMTILAGMAGKATGAPKIPNVEAEGGVEIPVSAVFSPEATDKSYVWIIDEQSGTVSRREVTTGELTDRGIRIKSGLNPGEWVATAGVHSLAEGQQVRILDGQED